MRIVFVKNTILSGQRFKVEAIIKKIYTIMSNSKITGSSSLAKEDAKTSESIVEVSNLTKRFGDLVAVSGASFDIRNGEYFSIIGPSGSGKTTLLRMLAGFEEPTGGKIIIGNKDCTYDKPYHRNTNMIFQNLALFPHLNVMENVAYGLVEAGMEKKTREKKVDDALQTVDLEGYQDRDISELSGGEQQRVALARGLVNEPTVLLLDEPLASLDEKLKESMKVELKRIQERTGTTFIYVTHDQEVAMAMSDRIAIIDGGVIQQIASPQKLYNRPANTFVADFTGAENIHKATAIEASEKETLVRLGNLELLGKNVGNARPQSGDNVHLVIRPETISVSTTDGRISGKVTDLVYKGALMDVIIEIDTGKKTIEVQAEVHHHSTESVSRGDTVYLDWKDQDPMVVGQ